MQNHLEIHQNHEESGFALLMVVFILSLATILITAFSSETFAFIRTNRSMTDGLQAELATKSALSLAIGVLEVPDDNTISIQPWQALSALPQIPIPGFDGEVRIQIIDQSGKINVNTIVSANPATGVGTTQNSGNIFQDDPKAEYWKGVILSLLNDLNGNPTSPQRPSSTTNPNNNNNPFANLNLSNEGIVAALHDSIDLDNLPHSSSTFPGKGIESDGTKSYFLNRPFTSIDELIDVPGISKPLLVKIAPHIRASYSTDDKINFNTVNPLILKALGMTEQEINDIVEKRSIAPLARDELQQLVQGSTNLANVASINSNSFRIIIRAKTVSVTRWLEAECLVQGGFGNKKLASVRKVRAL